jgi:hypothetical protein
LRAGRANGDDLGDALGDGDGLVLDGEGDVGEPDND